MSSESDRAAASCERFQLVVTLGPASWRTPEALIEAGATSLRINTSHASFDDARDALDRVHRLAPSVRVVLDLQGAKMRLGSFVERRLRTGDQLVFGAGGESDARVPLPHHELFEQISDGDTLRIDDGRLEFTVTSHVADALTAVALKEGVLRPRKGVNVAEHPVRLRGLSESDSGLCALAGRSQPAACALSFMVDGREAAWVRAIVPGCPVIGKVERREAVAALTAIDAATDEVWLCRGDLGSQLGPAEHARWIGQVSPSRLRRPVLVAGQVLEHLTAHADPTRSEVCHLYDLWARGFAGVVLSDETAIGVDPVRAVRIAAELIASFRE